MKLKSTFLILLCMCLVSCGDSDLPEDYISVSPKILAIKIDECEVMPGSRVYMRLLLSGKDIDQNTGLGVRWIIGDHYYEEDVPYNTDFVFDVPDDILTTYIPTTAEQIDVPVYASVQIDNQTLSATKYFRVTVNPVGQNPVISGISMNWNVNDTQQALLIENGATVTIHDQVPDIALTALTDALSENANDKLIYRWYVSTSQINTNQLEVTNQTDRIEAVLGPGAQAAQYLQSVVFSLNGKDGKDPYQNGRYNIYVVVRDNASNSQSTYQDRLGTDFFYFTVDIE